MAPQTRLHEKKQRMNNPEIRLRSAIERIENSLRRHTLRFLPAALFCLSLSLSAFAQGAATVLSTQVIPSTITLRCGEKEYQLFVVRARTTAEAKTTASALGVALVPPDKGTPKVFARYWFLSTDQASAAGGKLQLKRDDDSGNLGKQLAVYDETKFNEKVAGFFQGCENDKVVPAVSQVLTQANLQSSVEEIVTAFRTMEVELKAEAVINDQQNLKKTLTLAAADQVLFAQALRTWLEEQLEKGVLAVTAPTSKPDGIVSSDLSKGTGELEAAKKSLEETGKKVDSLSTLLRIVLGISVTVLLLAGFLIALFYFNPRLQRKTLFHPEDAAEIRRQALDELYRGFRIIGEPTEAQQGLEKILGHAEQRFSKAGSNPTEIASAYRDLEAELKQFSLSLARDKNGGDRTDAGDIVSVRQFISDNFGIKFAKTNMIEGLNDLTEACNENLLLLVGNNSKTPQRILSRLEDTRRHVERMWSKSSSEPCPEGALAILEQDWEFFQNTLQPLKQIDPAGALAYAQESVSLFAYLRQKFLRQSQGPGDLKTTVEKFFNDLEMIKSTYLSTDAQSNPTPENILTNLYGELEKNSTKLVSLNTAISALQQELTSPNGANTDTITQATQMAKYHKTVLELLKDYRPPDDSDNIIKTVQAIQKKVQNAASAVLTVMPKASGMIDVMVSSLATEFNANRGLATKAKALSERAERLQTDLTDSQTQAEESTKLAGALSQYVNLSAEKIIAPAQVRNILERFNAGESTHRQLRLRLSAAIPTLDQVIEVIRDAAREDTLDALRIYDFKAQLQGLLTNMEDFTGDAMWKDCLSSGFSQQWLHNLLRAELLARTYFAEDEVLRRLVDPLAEAGAALRTTLRHLNVRIPFITLLSKPPDKARVAYEVDTSLSKLPEVKRKVQATLRERCNLEDGLNFIVDVRLFPFQSDNAEDFNGHVVLVSPAEWS